MKKLVVTLMIMTGTNAWATTVLPIDMSASSNLNEQPKYTKVQEDLNSIFAKKKLNARASFSICAKSQVRDAETKLGRSEVASLNRTFCLVVASRSIADMIQVRRALDIDPSETVFSREGFLGQLTLR